MLKQLILAFIFGMILIFLFPVHAQDMSGHPHRDQAIHEKFYATWMMPSNRLASCCSDKDCSPAESRYVNGHWEARKVEDTDAPFTVIPEAAIEHDRDTPDGRSHLCGYPMRGLSAEGYHVLCFIPGAGG